MPSSSLIASQFSCLLKPRHNHDWRNVIDAFPEIKSLIVNNAHVDTTSHDATVEPLPEQHQRVEDGNLVSTQSIPWSTSFQSSKRPEADRSRLLPSFEYDCSYVTPLMTNLYGREWSEDGWYRWVGPDPWIELLLPLDWQAAEEWKVLLKLHGFASEENSSNLQIAIDTLQYPLSWIEGATYQCTFKLNAQAADLSTEAGPRPTKIVLSAPPARAVNENDQRLLSFALRSITITPSQPA